MLDKDTILKEFTQVEEAKKAVPHHSKENILKQFPETLDYKGWRFGMIQYNPRRSNDSYTICYLDKNDQYVRAAFGHPSEEGLKILFSNITKGTYDNILIDDYKL